MKSSVASIPASWLAAGIAQAELENRSAPENGSPHAHTEASSQEQAAASGSAMKAVLVILAYSGLGLLAYFALPPNIFSVVLILIVLPSIAVAIGKLFPTLALIAGWILTSTFVWLGAYLLHKGEFTPKGADFQPLGAVIAFVFYVVVSGLAAWIGAAFIRGATPEGSRGELKD